MIAGIILAVLFVAFLVWGSGKSSRRRQLDERGVGTDQPSSSSEQIYDANSFEHTNPHG